MNYKINYDPRILADTDLNNHVFAKHLTPEDIIQKHIDFEAKIRLMYASMPELIPNIICMSIPSYYHPYLSDKNPKPLSRDQLIEGLHKLNGVE